MLKNTRLSPEDKRYIEDHVLTKNKSPAQCARELNCCRTAIDKYLHHLTKMGAGTSRVTQRRKKMPPLTSRKLTAKECAYIERCSLRGDPARQTASALGRDLSTIKKYLRQPWLHSQRLFKEETNVQLRKNLNIEAHWVYDPAQPVPDGMPISATTGLRGPQATLRDERQNVVLHLAPFDHVVRIKGMWYLLNSLTARALLVFPGEEEAEQEEEDKKAKEEKDGDG